MIQLERFAALMCCWTPCRCDCPCPGCVALHRVHGQVLLLGKRLAVGHQFHHTTISRLITSTAILEVAQLNVASSRRTYRSSIERLSNQALKLVDA